MKKKKYEITFINEQNYPEKTQVSHTIISAADTFRDLLSCELKDQEGYWSDKDLSTVLIKEINDSFSLSKGGNESKQLKLPKINRIYKSTGEWIFGSIAVNRGMVLGFWKKEIVLGSDRGVHTMGIDHFWQCFQEYKKEEYPGEEEVKNFKEITPGTIVMNSNWPEE